MERRGSHRTLPGTHFQISNLQTITVNVIIIGSGPAGCAAAICCRQQGLKALLVTGKEERLAYDPTLVTPSETIHPGVRSVLLQLDAAHCIDMAMRGVYEGIQVNEQIDPLGEDRHGPWQGWHINRKIFDEALLRTVAAQGIDVLYETTVTDLLLQEERITGIRTSTGLEINAAFIIDASGDKRFAGKRLRFNEVHCSPPLVAWTGIAEGLPPTHALYERKYTSFIPASSGWTWLAPEFNGRCTWTRLSIKGEHHLLPPDGLAAYSDNTKTTVWNRRWRVFRPVCTEGLLLCGDAAGVIDPAAGQGILSALVSAGMAVKTIYACVRQPAYESLFLAQYDDWFISDYQEKMNRLKQFYTERGISL